MAQQPEKVVPVINEIAPNEKIGERPYEMVWANRQEERKPLVDFENLEGWKVECYDGANVEVRRSREQQMWGDYVCKVSFSGKSADSRFIIKPPKPIPIEGDFDCINLWIYGNNWGWEPLDKNNPRVEIDIHFVDSAGKPFRIYFWNVMWKEWFLAHRRIDESILKQISFPCSFTGIEVRGCSNEVFSTIYFDSLYFYKEELKPLSFAPRPKRNIEPRPGQNLGTNTGPGVLPFPTRKETILPTNYETSFETKAYQSGDNEFTFEYSGKDGNLKYVYKPSDGTFGEIEVFFNGKRICRPMREGGIKFEDKKETERMEFRSADLSDGILTVHFSSQYGDVQYRLWLWQKSLVIETTCLGGKASELSLGYADELQGNPELIRVPYLELARPSVLLIRDKTPLFISCWIDWYNSNASELYFDSWKKENSARFAGGTKYIPKTDGQRNDLFERIFLTVSPLFEETLPTIANPPSPVGKLAGEHLYHMGWLKEVTSKEGFDEEHELCKRELWSYGIRKLMKLSHETTWRDAGESFTLRTKAGPRKGGDEALKEYTKKQQSLGWLYGYYSNYTDFAPVNEHWNEDFVSRLPNNEWRPAWPRCYNLKPAKAVEFDAQLAKIVKQKFGIDCSYTDVHTCVPPWGYCDYDARVPGAGTFAATFYAYGELLLNDQLTYGPTFSEGTWHYMYAGLVTGNYAQCPNYDFFNEPLNVTFDLLKLHPLECDIDMGHSPFWGQGFEEKEDARYPDENLDRLIGATIAYGHIGLLTGRNAKENCRLYYMIQQVAKRYAMEKVKKIEYADENNRFHNVTEAILTGVINESRLYVEYENGLNIFVNWSRDKEWRLPEELTKITGRKIILPPSGWCAFDDKGFFEASHLKQGNRIDEVISPEYIYLDGRGKWTENDFLSARYACARIPLGEGKEQIVNVDNKEIGVKVSGQIKCYALNYDGEPQKEVPVRYSRGYAFIPCEAAVHSYLIQHLKEGQVASNFELKLSTDKVAPGDSIQGKLKLGPFAEPFKIEDLELVFENGYRTKIEPGKKELKAGEIGEQSVQFSLPRDLPYDEHCWVIARIKGDKEELVAYADFFTIPPFEINVDNNRVNLKDGKAELVFNFKNNLKGTTKGKVKFSIDNPDLLIEPTEFTLSQREQSLKVRLIQKKAEEIEKATLMVEVQLYDLSLAKIFKLGVESYQPVIANFYDGSLPFQWKICFRGGEEQPGDSKTGAIFERRKGMPVGGIEKDGLFSHPPYVGGVGWTSATFEKIKLPKEPCEFHAYIGLMDGGDLSDGVDYTVLVITGDGKEIEVLKEHGEQKKWKEVTADLSPFAGREVQFKFIADVGPNDNSTADWACWGEPIIRAKRRVYVISLKEMSGLISPENFRKGLVAYWKFDEGEGDIVQDGSGLGNRGEIINAQWVEGKSGWALRFDGKSSSVEVRHSDFLTPDKFTIIAWIKPESFISTDRGPMILSKYGGLWKGYMLLLEGTTGKPSLHIDTPQKEISVTSSEPVEIGKWSHIAATYDGKVARIYVNGVLKGSAEAELTHDTGVKLTIGKASWFEGAYFQGIIDEVKIYNRVLSEEEIRADYEGKGVTFFNFLYPLNYPVKNIRFLKKTLFVII
ncbi:LamG domain-containing protein [bacterium]|nr:LamG domain-containing protein [bacterium]